MLEMTECVEIWIGGDCNDANNVYHFELNDRVSIIATNGSHIMIMMHNGGHKEFYGLPYQARYM